MTADSGWINSNLRAKDPKLYLIWLRMLYTSLSFAALFKASVEFRVPPERLALEDENAFAKEEEAQEKVTKGDRSYSASSASKRPASTDTSDDLPVEKRLTKKPKSQRRRE
ncbi:hypothetical protein FOPG_14640 [Fusarium oxysporum f. sp. conglutinans race 2 54008]|uniref:Uncharacterized protein n=1 Tax=Fusarium oxysporum f. sp. conglutinans race 2 54008 TaxID=1089457 RepID=X0I7Z2_FUSOX|nr:hypothetical protein FOPG_14640 [Fusarium oxysporum f. sp. conglutinans race 2 54008]